MVDILEKNDMPGVKIVVNRIVWLFCKDFSVPAAEPGNPDVINNRDTQIREARSRFALYALNLHPFILNTKILVAHRFEEST